MQYIFNLRKEDNLPTRDKMASPKVSLIRRFHSTTKLISITDNLTVNFKDLNELLSSMKATVIIIINESYCISSNSTRG